MLQGQPSGEAFIQMDCEQSALICATQRHHKYMNFGKKQRYIEVFQCSIDDMNMVLTGGMPIQRHIQASGNYITLIIAFSIFFFSHEYTCTAAIIVYFLNDCFLLSQKAHNNNND